jgi:hypothetical protein
LRGASDWVTVPHVLVGDVGHALLERLVALPVDVLGDDLGPAHLELVALAAHGLDQHGELAAHPDRRPG